MRGMHILADPEREGVVSKANEGRRNHYPINTAYRERHPMEAHCAEDVFSLNRSR